MALLIVDESLCDVAHLAHVREFGKDGQMDILLTIQPVAEAAPRPAGNVIVEARYLRSVTGPDPEERSAMVSTTARVTLDSRLTGSVVLENAGADRLTASVLAIDGSSLITEEIVAVEGKAELTLNAEVLNALQNQPQVFPVVPAPIAVSRTVRLIQTGGVRLDYAKAVVAVTPIHDAALLDTSGIGALLNIDGTRIASMEVTGRDLGVLSGLAWIATHLAVDDTFTATFTKGPSLGWLWWLVSDQQVLGFVPDDLDSAESKTFVIALPALAPGGPDGSGETGRGGENPRIVPADVTESEVANNPQIFTEDPGTFCRPFSNPERVVSEKGFSVIARVTQPDIGPLGSTRSRTMSILSLDTISASPEPGRGLLGVLRRSRFVAPLPTVASMIEAALPSRYQFPRRYVDLLTQLPSGRTTMDASHPMQWEDDIAQYQATTVAIGHILEYRVRWRSNGYSLGTVASTLTLAPRQTKRIQKIEWSRSERNQRRERTRLSDEENDSTVREREYSDHVAASLSEWARGSSSADTEAIAGGIGFFAAGVLGGIGGGAGSAHSSSHSSGGRDTTASEQQRLRDAIRRHGDALRKFESTVVAEISQEETVTGTTEILRNANYAHALTVIYYQILRHLKVTTEFAGVRECIFVPFAIKPFNVYRAYRWRESLQKSMRAPQYSRALRYLKDVVTNFSTSNIAPGPRSVQQLNYVRGSIFVSLGVERPRDTADGAFDAGLWNVAQPLLLTPALGIFSMLAGLSTAQRDRVYQAEHAPSMAARWADNLQLRVGTRVLRADCTLASRYQFNRGARIDFVIPAGELNGMSRESFQQLTVVPQRDLPPGSVANLTRLSFTYNTERFEHSVEGRTNTNDLVTPIMGQAGSATVSMPLDEWERVDERLEIRRAVDQLIEHLNEHVEYYTKAVLWRMDRDRLLMLLDGFYVPNTNDVSIASVVDREPIGIIGNSIVYRVGAATFLGIGKITAPADLYNLYAESDPVSDPVLISLPTDGLYAQTIMDECAALEEHYGNTDWVLNDKEPDLGTIDPSLLLTRRADPTGTTTPTPFPATIINLQNAPEAPAPSGLSGVLDAVTNPNAFRDMAGLAATQANALGALNTAANLATNFGNQAAALELAKLAKADHATRTADQKIASIKGSRDKGLTSPENAAKAASDVLSAMNPDSPATPAPHENTAINSAIEAVRDVPGSTIEATTAEGGVKVQVGDGVKLASLDEPLQRVCGFFGPNDVVVTATELRNAVHDATVATQADWRDAAGAVLEEDADSQFGHLTNYWMAAKNRIQPTTLPALQANALLPTTNYGNLLGPVPGTTSAQVNAAIAAARTSLLTGAPDTGAPANLNSLIDQSLRSARESRLDAQFTGPWSAVFVIACVRGAAIDLGLEGLTADGRHTGIDELLAATSAHSVYTLAAYRHRFGPNARSGTYHAFRTTEHSPRIGDIIVQDRRDTIGINGVVQFDAIPVTLAGGLALHGDIVVEAAADHVVTLGGNVGNSVRRGRYPRDANGQLVVDRVQFFTQEDDTGTLPNLPSGNANPGLNGLSTGRIFALLSPVELCAVIPGQEFHGGVIA